MREKEKRKERVEGRKGRRRDKRRREEEKRKEGCKSDE